MKLSSEKQHTSQPNIPLPATPLPHTPLSWGEFAQRLFAVVFSIGITVAIISSRHVIEAYAVYGYPSVFIISVLGNATLIFPAPSFAVVFAMGGILNPYLVGIIAGCGAALGEMTGFLAGFGGRGALENKAIYRRLETLMREWGAWIIFLLAVIPNPLFDVGGIIAGALKMPWWKFLGTAALGKSIRFVLLALFSAWGISWLG